ncbi:hypothetical protein [Ornithinimicrobium faecis]|uniref:hypothetical protein n=1 Tax=Ornithinimicrobium faecis TaxID=2934158 RepID=UPI002118E688|nr:hypothetical protein [Ornithinimicrobium sp. HY1745]
MRKTTRPYPAQPRRRSRRKGGTIAIIAVIAALAYGANLNEDAQPVVEAAPVQTTPETPSTPEPTAEPPTAPTSESEPTQESAPSPTTEAAPTPTTEPDTVEPEITTAEVVEAESALAAAPGTALAALADLEIKGRAATTGYDRDLFQYRSHDLDRNGCDARIICIRVASQS